MFVGKKKLVDSDILLDIEAQRQRERLKLIEMERKKRDMLALSKQNDPNNNNQQSNNLKENNNNKENKNNIVQVKRVNIVSPSATSNKDNDQLAPLETTKKLKRKPKFKKSGGIDPSSVVAAESIDLPPLNPSKNTTQASSLNDEQPPSRSQNVKSKSPAVPREQPKEQNNNADVNTATPNNKDANSNQQPAPKQHHQHVQQPNSPNHLNANVNNTNKPQPILPHIVKPTKEVVKEPSNKLKRQVRSPPPQF